MVFSFKWRRYRLAAYWERVFTKELLSSLGNMSSVHTELSLMKKIVNTQSTSYLNAYCDVNIFSLFLSFQRDYQYYNEFGELKYGLSGVDLLLCLIVRLFPHCVSLMIAVWPCLKLAVSESGFNIVLDKAMSFSHGFTLRISVCMHIDNKLTIQYSVHFGSFSLFTI